MDPSLSPTSIYYAIKKETWRRTVVLSFQTLGILYGRLSTAPLYVFGSINPSDIKSGQQIYELFSFVFWTLTFIPLLKYAFIILKADDNGEGGTFALYSLLCRHANVGLLPSDISTTELMHQEEGTPSKMKVESRARRAIGRYKSSHYLILFLALLGSCMIICDGIFTPALSVLSATSDLRRSLSKLAARFTSSEKARHSIDKYLKRYIPVPAACAILVCLFMLQRYGTNRVGVIFAPIVIIWLMFISGFGIYNIIHHPQILWAISPAYMFRFIKKIDISSWKLLSSIVLCIAGSEAMFADLGHFSKRSIKVTFVFLVYPALVLCYAGQAAFFSKHLGTSDDVAHLSESITHRHLQRIFTILSLFASLVGSQATITATFSIINQCQALACFPRVNVIHTSEKVHGQVYVPDANWLIMVLSLTILIGFRDISAIANATGLAVIYGMLVTTCLMSLIIALQWEKTAVFLSVSFLLLFGSIEAIYLSSCFLNFSKGAWCIVALSLIFMTVMVSWHYGTIKKHEFDIENKVTVDWLTELSPGLGVSRVAGIGFVHSNIVTGIPAFFSHFITNIPAFHQVLILVSFKSLHVPFVPKNERYLIGRIGHKEYKIYRCIVRYGYRDHVRNINDFEDQIISSIGEFIAREEQHHELLFLEEGRMIILGSRMTDGNVLVPVVVGGEQSGSGQHVADIENPTTTTTKRKKVRFMLPANSPKMNPSVRKELQQLVDARESGTAYFMGHSHLKVRKGSNFVKQFLVKVYAFLDKNCREPPVALDIPHAALLEVGMVYTI
ncbi:potassium transporter 25-like [Nicotiana tabacum]|uniref:Potassium transporter n=2 Tax=Nicotiana tabacum TaxID=4097 RepID=A0A1S3ZVB0_TOBAC|nr:PREDICTED: potassium transporter 25-like isoform X1 [Nicotiana tabacum]